MNLSPDQISALDKDIAAFHEQRALRRRQHWPRSKIDAYAEQLSLMQSQKVSQRQMVAWLEKRGCSATQPTVQRFLKKLRTKISHAELP